jgi:hypothetical protein
VPALEGKPLRVGLRHGEFPQGPHVQPSVGQPGNHPQIEGKVGLDCGVVVQADPSSYYNLGASKLAMPEAGLEPARASGTGGIRGGTREIAGHRRSDAADNLRIRSDDPDVAILIGHLGREIAAAYIRRYRCLRRWLWNGCISPRSADCPAVLGVESGPWTGGVDEVDQPTARGNASLRS